jgi:hypothetical protein
MTLNIADLDIEGNTYHAVVLNDSQEHEEAIMNHDSAWYINQFEYANYMYSRCEDGYASIESH